MESLKTFKVEISVWKALFLLAFFVLSNFLSYQIGHLKGLVMFLGGKIEQGDKIVSLAERNYALMVENQELAAEIKKKTAQIGLASEMLSVFMVEKNLAGAMVKCYEDRNAAREIIIQMFLKGKRFRPKSPWQISFQKKSLTNGDVVRCGRNMLRSDFDKNGYVLPHLLKKMPVGIFIQLPGDARAYVYDYKANVLHCFGAPLAIPQQNFLLVDRWRGN